MIFLTFENGLDYNISISDNSLVGFYVGFSSSKNYNLQPGVGISFVQLFNNKKIK